MGANIQYLYLETEEANWNSAIINFIIYTRDFLILSGLLKYVQQEHEFKQLI